MGKALAAAMGGMAPDTPDKTNETPIQAAGGLEKRVRDKKKWRRSLASARLP